MPKKSLGSEERIKKYEGFIRELEAFATQRPAIYRLRLIALAALGYGYVLFWFGVGAWTLYWLWGEFSAGDVSAGLIKLGLLALVLEYMILRSLWVRIEAPTDGIEITEKEAPELFALIQDLARQLRSASFHHVRLNMEYNASVLQRPRFGVFGSYRNYLLIGLPLLHSLTPDQFRAVLAHEFGHLSANHGRFGVFIYRIRRTWFQLLSMMEGESSLINVVFSKFFAWYAPFFNAYSFVLARQDEYTADACGVQLTSSRTMGEALAGVVAGMSRVDSDFWEPLYKRANELSEPPLSPFMGLAKCFRASGMGSEVAMALRRALQEKTGYADTHPSLSDRLKGIGYRDLEKGAENWTPPPLEESAAQSFLGRNLLVFEERLEALWAEAMREPWEARHKEVRERLKELARLDAKAESEELSQQEAVQRALWVEEFREDDALAMQIYQDLLARFPDYCPACFHLGRLFLKQKSDQGVALLEKVIALEPDGAFNACELLYGYMMEQGREAEAERYWSRYHKLSDELELAEAERVRLGREDVLTPHGLTPDTLIPLVAVLAAQPEVTAAYLVRKETKIWAQKPCFLLFLEIKSRGLQDKNALAKQVIDSLLSRIEFPHEMYVWHREANPGYFKRVWKVEGSQIFSL